ncbi:hypothetical protein Pint_02892 [Pistacia integerrima]|uniref:Uncharacterized protein n=1 Tax=Pistacia integerrima TaxID=434235 RepID=A0ACC0ZHL9_9ROSI|nr:hypothetical protein Pint_02892 [Pistacia integerrima]
MLLVIFFLPCLNFSYFQKQTSITYVTLSILALMVLPLFYIFVYLYQRGIRRGTQALKRISESKQKKKSF